MVGSACVVSLAFAIFFAALFISSFVMKKKLEEDYRTVHKLVSARGNNRDQYAPPLEYDVYAYFYDITKYHFLFETIGFVGACLSSIVGCFLV